MHGSAPCTAVRNIRTDDIPPSQQVDCGRRKSFRAFLKRFRERHNFRLPRRVANLCASALCDHPKLTTASRSCSLIQLSLQAKCSRHLLRTSYVRSTKHYDVFQEEIENSAMGVGDSSPVDQKRVACFSGICARGCPTGRASSVHLRLLQVLATQQCGVRWDDGCY